MNCDNSLTKVITMLFYSPHVCGRLPSHLTGCYPQIPSSCVSTRWRSDMLLCWVKCPNGIYRLRLCIVDVCSRSEEHTSELQSRFDLVCRLLLEKKNKCI